MKHSKINPTDACRADIVSFFREYCISFSGEGDPEETVREWSQKVFKILAKHGIDMAPESKGLDLEAGKFRFRVLEPGRVCVKIWNSGEFVFDSTEVDELAAKFAEIRRLRAGAEGGDMGASREV